MAQYDRRRFIAAMTVGLLATPRTALAQPAARMARVGILGVGPTPSPQELARSVATNRFWISMRELGWIDGKNMTVVRRFGESTGQLGAGAADLVRLKVDVLFVGSAGLAKILQAATTSIPIVVGRAEGDLVAAGLVDSLARPGRNITGAQLLNDDLVSKRLELLKVLVPNLSKVAVLREDVTTAILPEIPARYDRQVSTAAQALAVEVHTFAVRGARDVDVAFPAMVRKRDEGVLVTSSSFMFVHRHVIVDLAVSQRIPAVYELQDFVDAGGLMSYGVDMAEMERRAATYVDRILKGAKPADLPIEQPTNFDFVINMKTAKAMGLKVPPSLVARADKVLE
jgi:putative tryptophan/tyrosine transport system substrate-binding protein